MPINKPAPGASDEDAPILIELRRRLEATDDPAERAALRIRQGLYLARTDRLLDAESLPAEVRAAWSGQEDLRVYVWLWILEGVLAFYRSSRTRERQRLQQAQAAALKVGMRPEAELAAAWLAHFAYVDGNYPAMLRSLLDSSLGTAALDESVARSSLTLACALQWFGEEDLAATWFGRAREVARRTGDRAGIMAATANRLMLRLSDNWLNFAFGEPLRFEPVALRQELMGILGYEQLSGSASLQEQNEIALLRLNVIKGSEDKALALASEMSSAVQRHSEPALAIASVVRAWLLGRSADASHAAILLADALAAFQGPLLDDDDAASCWALLAQLAHRAEQTAEAERLQTLAQLARQRYLGALEPLRAELLTVEREAVARWSLS